MKNMHNNELEINERLVRSLLESQCTQWAHLPLNAIPSSGTDNVLFRLGNDYIIRLPRIEWAPGGASQGIHKEFEWVSKLARLLKTPISEPVFKGSPNADYPWFWIIAKWNEGDNPAFEAAHEYEDLAKDLAHFLNDLHRIKLQNGPFSRRGVPLKTLDRETKQAIERLEGELDTNTMLDLWAQLSHTPTFTELPVWMHGDFLPGNILVKNNRLSAVIDFSDVGIGDPACDLIIAWSLLKPLSRKIFRDHLENIDHDTWKRGRGWALSIALIILPYYRNSNPILTNIAKHILEQINTS